LAEWPCALEGLVINPEFWRGKRVFLTGHTGFKGGWLALWLTKMGAQVFGYSLEPPSQPNLFSILKLEKRLAVSSIADIREAEALERAMADSQPDIVMHLAAQPLVRYSYREPAETFAVNVMGTVNLLQAVRSVDTASAVVNVTTDKCYENKEWVWPYRENEALGGYDPYSSSKACAEMVSAAYRQSFLNEAGVPLATARAGNVIGGGDFAEDRLIPDFLRATDAGENLIIRSPEAVRPWQHVLEPLAGYLSLAQLLSEVGVGYAEAWNFGPDESDAKTVKWIAEALCSRIPGAAWEHDGSPQVHEALALRLDSSKAKSRLQWRPRWNLQSALEMTLSWHQAWRSGKDMYAVTCEQIDAYMASPVG